MKYSSFVLKLKETIIEIKAGKLSEQFSIRENDVFMIKISKLQ